MRQAYLRSHHLRRHSRRRLTAPFESRNLRRFYPEDLEEFRSQCGGSCSGNMLVFAGESLSYLSQGKVPALMWRAVPLTKPPKTKPAPGAPPHRPAMSCLFRARAMRRIETQLIPMPPLPPLNIRELETLTPAMQKKLWPWKRYGTYFTAQGGKYYWAAPPKMKEMKIEKKDIKKGFLHNKDGTVKDF